MPWLTPGPEALTPAPHLSADQSVENMALTTTLTPLVTKINDFPLEVIKESDLFWVLSHLSLDMGNFLENFLC